MGEAVNFETTTFRVFYTCLGLLALKVFFMVILTARLRFKKKIVMNPEDCVFRKGLKVKFDDPDIERVKRAHRNDLENIPLFISSAFLYTSLKPSPFLAIPLIVAYTIARFAYTYVYAISVAKQPARVICFGIGFVITAYMAAYVVLSMRDMA